MRLKDLEQLSEVELRNLVFRLDKELDDEQRKNATLGDEISELERELVYRDNSPKGQGKMKREETGKELMERMHAEEVMARLGHGDALAYADREKWDGDEIKLGERVLKKTASKKGFRLISKEHIVYVPFLIENVDYEPWKKMMK